jgi:hypothetical protein
LFEPQRVLNYIQSGWLERYTLNHTTYERSKFDLHFFLKMSSYVSNTHGSVDFLLSHIREQTHTYPI